jgi:hypothetical protein
MPDMTEVCALLRRLALSRVVIRTFQRIIAPRDSYVSLTRNASRPAVRPRMPSSVAKPFNVTLIQPPGFIPSLALKEAADYLHTAIQFCGYPCLRTTNHVAKDAYNILFCAHLLADYHIYRISADSIIFNSESLEDMQERRFYSSAYPGVLSRFFVWDYSYRNLPLIPHANKAVIPFLYNDKLKLKDLVRDAGESILFYGRVTDRREAILDELRGRGVPVRIILGEYDQSRDIQMMASWAVLNLHKNDHTRTFEPIRCFYPLINSVPVISESADDEAAEAFADSIFFFDRSNLVDGICTLHNNRNLFEQRSGVMLAEFRKKDPIPTIAVAIETFLSWHINAA